jgi:hypothetical protein
VAPPPQQLPQWLRHQIELVATLALMSLLLVRVRVQQVALLRLPRQHEVPVAAGSEALPSLVMMMAPPLAWWRRRRVVTATTSQAQW